MMVFLFLFVLLPGKLGVKFKSKMTMAYRGCHYLGVRQQRSLKCGQRAKDAAQLAECLPSMCEALVQLPELHKTRSGSIYTLVISALVG